MKQFLIDLLGSEHVLTPSDDLEKYREDYTEAKACDPDLVAMVENTEQVRKIVVRANELKMAITPRVYGTNVGGLTIPNQGGVVLDMTRMNRVLEVNVDDMYAVIEPGVTQQIIKDYLIDNDLPLTLGYSLAPPDTSVFANALLGGLTNRSLKYGDQSDWISGLEVVLADGRILKTGAWAHQGTSPFGLVPFPDLSGLFIAWQGTTGIATKMAFQLWPAHPLNKRLFVLTYDPKATYRAMRRLVKKEICDDIGGLSWPSGKMMMGVKHPHPVPAEGEPQFFLYIDLTAEIEEEMKVKEKILLSVIEELRADGERYEDPLDIETLVKVNPKMIKFAEFPTDLDFLTDHGGGGLTWVGTYGPLSKFTEGAEAGIEIMTRHGFPPIIVSRPMRGGHFGVLRFIAIFDKKNEEEIERIKTLNSELLDMLSEKGFLMYKTPIWAWRRMSKKINPTMLDVIEGVRNLLDPNHILNPGKLERQ